MKRFVVVGLGNFGASVAESLHAKGHEVIALDSNELAVDRISPHVSRAVVGDGTQFQILERVGARGADGFYHLARWTIRSHRGWSGRDFALCRCGR